MVDERGGETGKLLDQVSAALIQVEGQTNNSLEVLRRLGGRETAAICGAILAARSQHIPVLIDGYTALAAALVLYKLEPSSLNHVKFAQMPANKDAANLLSQIGVEAILESKLAVTDVEGLLLATGIMKSACLLLQGKL